MKHEISEQDKELITQLLGVLHPKAKIYLFGSRARGTASQSSDIDLALDAGYKLSITDRAIAQRVVEALNIAQKIDIVDMHSIPDHLKQTILEEGILWKS